MPAIIEKGIPGATHHRLYDDEAAVGKAVAKLEEFFGRSL
jgi:hypothetical protein